MSMKRTKKASAGKGSQAEGGLGFNPPPAELPKWADSIALRPDDAFTPYNIGKLLVRGELVLHAKFGKGQVIGVDTGKVDVLFEEGTKKLAHGVTL
jgi:hypothetical protein